MEFHNKDAPKPSARFYTESEIRIGREFAHKLSEKFPILVDSVILSRTPRAHAIKAHQIPIVVILNDVTNEIGQKEIQKYIHDTTQIVASVSGNIHVETIKLHEHFELLKRRDQTHLDFVRNGVCFKDGGFFSTAQTMLATGRFRPTMESVGILYAQSQIAMRNADSNLKQAIVTLYWAATESCHAALMSQGVHSPPPAHLADSLREHFVKHRKLEKEYADIMERLFFQAKAIMHKEAKDVDGKMYDKLLSDTTRFVDRMKRIVAS